MSDTPYALGELVYLTNRLARGDPDPAFTNESGPGMITDIRVEEPYRARYTVKWLKSGRQMMFHADVLMRVPEGEP